MNTLKMTRKETANKATKFIYQIIGQDGTVLCERKTNREYAACLGYTDGHDGKSDCPWFFGRMDLVGKGDSKHAYAKMLANDPDVADWFLATI